MPLSFHNIRSYVWIITILAVSMILMVAAMSIFSLFGVQLQSDIPEEDVYQNLYENLLLFSCGQNLSEDAFSGMDTLYVNASPERRIVEVILQTLWFNYTGDREFSIIERIRALSDSSYTVLITQDEDGNILWSFMIEGAKDFREQFSLFHERFSVKFPRVVIKERIVPSGKTVRDVRVRENVIEYTEGQSSGFTITQSIHIDSKEMFISAVSRKSIAFGNDREALLFMLNNKDCRRKSMVVTASGINLFSAIFPDSYLLSYARGFMNLVKEDHISLSSWRCIP